jgi:hypothetical protein
MNKNSKLFKEYVEKLIDRTYKILPLYEEENEGLSKNIQSLLFELNGLPYVVDGVLDSDYIILLATLESIYDETIVHTNDEEAHSLIKREVFKCVNIVKKIGESITESGDY